MGCCGSRRLRRPPGAVMRRGFVGNAPGPQSGELPLITLSYTASRPLTVRGAATGTFYRVRGPQRLFVDPRDAPQLVSRKDFVYEVEEEASLTATPA